MRKIGEIAWKIVAAMGVDGAIPIADPEQIGEPHCDISSKDSGIQYMGLVTGKIYKVRAHDGSRE